MPAVKRSNSQQDHNFGKRNHAPIMPQAWSAGIASSICLCLIPVIAPRNRLSAVRCAIIYTARHVAPGVKLLGGPLSPTGCQEVTHV